MVAPDLRRPPLRPRYRHGRYSRLMGINEAATVSMLDSARSVFVSRSPPTAAASSIRQGTQSLAVFETTTGAVSAASASRRFPCT
jgi:hypothetical protein